jgi:hypothetical protein
MSDEKIDAFADEFDTVDGLKRLRANTKFLNLMYAISNDHDDDEETQMESLFNRLEPWIKGIYHPFDKTKSVYVEDVLHVRISTKSWNDVSEKQRSTGIKFLETKFLEKGLVLCHFTTPPGHGPAVTHYKIKLR